MKLLRHILSHLFLISFLIAVVSVFYYRTFLFPDSMVGKINEIANDVYPPAVKFASKRAYFWSIKGEQIVSFDDLKFYKKEDVAEKKSKETAEPVIASQVKTNEAEMTEPENKEDTSEEKVAERTQNLNNKQRVAEEANASILKHDDTVASSGSESENLPLAVKDRDSSSERDLLIDARNAFNQGDMALSEKYYQQLVAMMNDEPDVYGELGNVYYAQGKWDEAGQAYFDAASRLIAEGNQQQVIYLHRVIQGLSSEHADKLSQLMQRR